MMKRQSKRDQARPLLMQDSPLLSDQMPDSPETKGNSQSNDIRKKKSSWRKRLFRKSSKKRVEAKSGNSSVPEVNPSGSYESEDYSTDHQSDPDKRDDGPESTIADTTTTTATTATSSTKSRATPKSALKSAAHVPAAPVLPKMSTEAALVLRRPFGRASMAARNLKVSFKQYCKPLFPYLNSAHLFATVACEGGTGRVGCRRLHLDVPSDNSETWRGRRDNSRLYQWSHM